MKFNTIPVKININKHILRGKVAILSWYFLNHPILDKISNTFVPIVRL